MHTTCLSVDTAELRIGIIFYGLFRLDRRLVFIVEFAQVFRKKLLLAELMIC